MVIFPQPNFLPVFLSAAPEMLVGANQHRGSEVTSDPKTNSDMAKDAAVSIKTIQQAKTAHKAGFRLPFIRPPSLLVERAQIRPSYRFF